MDFTRFLVIREWLHAWRTLFQNKGFALASGLVDLVFFLAFGFVTAPVFDKLTEHVIIIGSLVSEQMRVAVGRTRPAVLDALFQQPVSQYTWQFLGLLAVLALVVFVLYALLQGTAWWLASSVVHKPLRWREFLMGFARVHVLWFALYAAWYCVDAILDLRRIVVAKALGQAVSGTNVVLLAVLGIVIYFALISSPLLSIRKAFALGIRKAGVLLPAFVVVDAHFLAGNFVVRWLGTLNTTVMFVVGTVLLLIVLAWTRVYLSMIVRRVA